MKYWPEKNLMTKLHTLTYFQKEENQIYFYIKFDDNQCCR